MHNAERGTLCSQPDISVKNNIACILLFLDICEKLLHGVEQKASKERSLGRTALFKYIRRLHLFSRTK